MVVSKPKNDHFAHAIVNNGYLNPQCTGVPDKRMTAGRGKAEKNAAKRDTEERDAAEKGHGEKDARKHD